MSWLGFNLMGLNVDSLIVTMMLQMERWLIWLDAIWLKISGTCYNWIRRWKCNIFFQGKFLCWCTS